jgi:hypothetical protein
MAKKMLINADMLLATPRRSEPVVSPKPVIEVQKETLIEAEKIQVPPSVLSPPVAVQVEKPVPVSIVKEEKKIIEVTSVQRGLKAGETRATFIVKEEALEKIKAIAYWDRQNIKDIVQIAIEAYIKQYENTKGTVQAIP